MFSSVDFVPADVRYVWIMAGFWLWLLFGQYAAELLGRHVATTHYTLFALMRWVRVVLHEMSHAIIALITGQDITRIHASHISGQVEFNGEVAYHGLVAAAPLLLWGVAGALMHYVMQAQALPFAYGVGLSVLVPLLIMAGVPSMPDFGVMGIVTKFFTSYIVGSAILIGVLGVAELTLFSWFPSCGDMVYGAIGSVVGSA